uniref:BPTI/Kunitz inhibitor domain-containing protein n=1 Tax=Amblyomma maculatum TaxID=34609 RepID=G3MSC4_AMBMU
MILTYVLMLQLCGLSLGEPPVANDPRCRLSSIIITTPGCRTPGWQFDQVSKECAPTCNLAAAFQDKAACDGTCRSKQVCSAARPVSGCLQASQVNVYYFERHSKTCIRDVACLFTGNNFPTAAECVQTCGGSVAQPEYCREPPNQGYTCDEESGSYRYFYDVNAKQCVWFPYFGCGGGQNNFRSYEECRERCLHY